MSNFNDRISNQHQHVGNSPDIEDLIWIPVFISITFIISVHILLSARMNYCITHRREAFKM